MAQIISDLPRTECAIPTHRRRSNVLRLRDGRGSPRTRTREQHGDSQRQVDDAYQRDGKRDRRGREEFQLETRVVALRAVCQHEIS